MPTGGFNECPGISGPIVDIVNRTDDAVDAFVTGHTHQAYNCRIDNRLVTSASSFGWVYTDIDLQISPESGDVVTMRADNVVVTQDVAKDAAETALIDRYSAIAAPLENRVVGSVTTDIRRVANPAGKSALGDVIADGQRAATASAGTAPAGPAPITTAAGATPANKRTTVFLVPLTAPRPPTAR